MILHVQLLGEENVMAESDYKVAELVGTSTESCVLGANSYSWHKFERFPSLVKCGGLVTMIQ